MTIKVLFVCLGNICRSPAAEGVFLSLLKSKGLEGQFFVDSAGTGGWHIGSTPDKRMQQAANRRGIKLPSLARQITEKDLDDFDLILTMDDENYDSVQTLAKRSKLKVSANIRKMLSYSRFSDLAEVPDPYYGGDQGFEDVLDLLEDSCEGLLASLDVTN